MAKILWRTVTFFHDWVEDDKSVPKNILQRLQYAEIIGTIDWYSVGPDDKEIPVTDDTGLIEKLLNHRPRRGSLFRFAAGGKSPYNWEMTLALSPFDKSVGQVEGYNILNIWFDSVLFPGDEGSDRLISLFRELHTPLTTEFAFIHPYERWSNLTDPLNGAYKTALTLDPMFKGVYWAIFLDNHHLRFFEPLKLESVHGGYQFEYHEGKSLFLRVSRNIMDSLDPIIEEEMLSLTEMFRSARI